MADFVDEIEIDKIRNTAEIFPFMAKFVFYGLQKSFWSNCMEETALKTFFNYRVSPQFGLRSF